jgi:hypothetical protein
VPQRRERSYWNRAARRSRKLAAPATRTEDVADVAQQNRVKRVGKIEMFSKLIKKNIQEGEFKWPKMEISKIKVRCI